MIGQMADEDRATDKAADASEAIRASEPIPPRPPLAPMPLMNTSFEPGTCLACVGGDEAQGDARHRTCGVLLLQRPA